LIVPTCGLICQDIVEADGVVANCTVWDAAKEIWLGLTTNGGVRVIEACSLLVAFATLVTVRRIV
jgi:hypothetical protein